MRDAVSEAGLKLENRGTFGIVRIVGYSSQTSVQMSRPVDHTLPYTVYGVRRKDREPLLQFIHDALAASGCRVMHSSAADHAPFRMSFETASGERMGIIAYAFFANNRDTKNRPKDEYRFQLKYGSKQRNNVHHLWQDPYGLHTTLLVGISPGERFFVGYDPAAQPNEALHFAGVQRVIRG